MNKIMTLELLFDIEVDEDKTLPFVMRDEILKAASERIKSLGQTWNKDAITLREEYLIEEDEPKEKNQYQFVFNAKKIDALGRLNRYERTAYGKNMHIARLSLYDEFEHVIVLDVTKIEVDGQNAEQFKEITAAEMDHSHIIVTLNGMRIRTVKKTDCETINSGIMELNVIGLNIPDTDMLFLEDKMGHRFKRTFPNHQKNVYAFKRI